MKFANIHKISLIIFLLLPVAAHSQARIEPASATAPGGSYRLDGVRVHAAGADEVIRNAFQNMIAARSYRIHGEMTAMNGATFQLEQEFSAPNRVHTVAQSDKNGPAMRVEAIIIGKNGYVKTGGDWTRQTFDEQIFDFSKVQKQIDDVLNAVGDQFEIADPTSVNGTPVTTYQIVSATDVIFKVSVGTKDNMLYRVEFDSPSNPSKGVPGQKVVLSISDYNTNIKIEPPR